MPGKAPLSLPLPDGRPLSLADDGDCLDLRLEGQPVLQARCLQQGSRPVLQPVELPLQAQAEALELLAYACFAGDSACQVVALMLDEVDPALLMRGLLLAGDAEGLWLIERCMFWQLSGRFLRAPASAGYPQRQVMHPSGRRHPRRAPKPVGEVYRRFDARLGAWIALRSLDVEGDLPRFNRWQNHPRVAAFWQEEGDLEQHRTYLTALAADPRVLSLIGAFDEQPFAYYEAYWAKEDRIAPFYRAADYDRGIHMLVGEDAHRGPHKVAAWLAALVHYLFLDEPRTQRIVCEPRADNARMIQHLQALGFARHMEFDFPHKRAALMVLEREAFFARCTLC
jgi:RimJ/RimL family protein N-acetyltransferase